MDDELGNLILNLSAGLFPENLTKDEVILLEKEYGSDWFTRLGYSEPKFKKPIWSENANT